MKKENSKIIFIGTPEFGSIVLDKICENGLLPILVITAKDKPVGRRQEVMSPPVKVTAKKYNIKTLQPEKIIETRDDLEKIKPDLIVVAAFGQILPKEILNIPRFGCLNVHPSLLPKYRGASPIQSAILNGEEKTGVTILLMKEKMDQGPIIYQESYKIKSETTYKELERELAGLGGKLILNCAPKWIQGKLKAKPQDEQKATYAGVLTKDEGAVDWKKSAEYIERQVRAYNPWPGTFCKFPEGEKFKKMKIIRANTLVQTKYGPFGPVGKTFLAPNDKIAVQTGKDFLIITILQPEGRKPMSSAEFLRGHWDFIGTILY